MILLAVFIGLVFAYGLVSRRLERTILTGPMAFTVAGICAEILAPGALAASMNPHFLLYLAEVGLVLLLFTDAARTNLSLLWNIRELPARLLGIGLPLTILLGAVAAHLVFPALGLWEVAVLAAILAPTDAGLGQVVVASPRAPLRIREALTVEAGLNDGLSVPFLLFFMALAAAAAEGARASFAQFVVEQLGYGVAVGVGVGLVGGWLLDRAARRDWISDAFRQSGVVALPLLCMLISDAISASMFLGSERIPRRPPPQPGVRRDLGPDHQPVGVFPLWHGRGVQLARHRPPDRPLRRAKPHRRAHDPGGAVADRHRS
jgi:sodium/hydrogen antiporter